MDLTLILANVNRVDILVKLKTMYVPRECHRTMASNDNFVGVCIFTNDGNREYRDSSGALIKSGDLFVVPTEHLSTSFRRYGSYHWQTYDRQYGDIRKQHGVVVVGFSQ